MFRSWVSDGTAGFWNSSCLNSVQEDSAAAAALQLRQGRKPWKMPVRPLSGATDLEKIELSQV
jgi:hypothetical protein